MKPDTDQYVTPAEYQRRCAHPDTGKPLTPRAYYARIKRGTLAEVELYGRKFVDVTKYPPGRQDDFQRIPDPKKARKRAGLPPAKRGPKPGSTRKKKDADQLPAAAENPTPGPAEGLDEAPDWL